MKNEYYQPDYPTPPCRNYLLLFKIDSNGVTISHIFRIRVSVCYLIFRYNWEWRAQSKMFSEAQFETLMILKNQSDFSLYVPRVVNNTQLNGLTVQKNVSVELWNITYTSHCHLLYEPPAAIKSRNKANCISMLWSGANIVQLNNLIVAYWSMKILLPYIRPPLDLHLYLIVDYWNPDAYDALACSISS